MIIRVLPLFLTPNSGYGANNTAFSRCRKDLQRKYLEALGLMLFMYLSNGMNLRDVCMLRYNRFYFQTGGKQIQFKRHKTAERVEASIEFPVLLQIQTIIDRLGNPPKEGELIFPYLEKVIGDDFLENKHTALLGHAIRDRMKTVTKLLDLSCVPTPTWSRHSFATNLTHAGVPKDYIAWAMGHASNSVTNNYIASYCYEQMVEYNSLLLYSAQTVEYILSQANALSQTEKDKLIRRLLEK